MLAAPALLSAPVGVHLLQPVLPGQGPALQAVQLRQELHLYTTKVIVRDRKLLR
jgi:hypothetical protein